MRDFILLIVKQIVNNPEQVELTENVNEMGAFLYTLKVAPEDMGIIIGKEGKTIKSLRNLIKSKAIIDGTRVNLELHEDTPRPVKEPKETQEDVTA